MRIDRDEIARYGLLVGDVQDVIMSAHGRHERQLRPSRGSSATRCNVRYPHELRDNLPALRQTLVATPSGAQVPLGQLAVIDDPQGPADGEERERPAHQLGLRGHRRHRRRHLRAERAARRWRRASTCRPATRSSGPGSTSTCRRPTERLSVVVPLAAVLIVLLLYMATRSWLRVGIVLLAVPFSLVGAVWLLYFLGYNLSLAVWVGIIALAGLDAETGLVMLLYLDNSFERVPSARAACATRTTCGARSTTAR